MREREKRTNQRYCLVVIARLKHVMLESKEKEMINWEKSYDVCNYFVQMSQLTLKKNHASYDRVVTHLESSSFLLL